MSEAAKHAAEVKARNVVSIIESQMEVEVVGESLEFHECIGGVGEGTGMFRAVIRARTDSGGQLSIRELDQLGADEFHVGQDEVRGYRVRGFRFEGDRRLDAFFAEDGSDELTIRIETDCTPG